MLPEAQFDESASRLSTSRTSDGTVLAALLKAAHNAGLDPVAELYNEALELAKEGHYGQARTRLEVLLGLSPSDGEAHLLLARLHLAGQQWRRAVASLDDAAACGVHVPEELREEVIAHLQADVDVDEEERAARLTRESAELKKLRSEARRLRSENAHLALHARQMEREATRWAWVATGTTFVAIAFIFPATLWGYGSTPVWASAEPAAVVETVDAPAAPADVVRDPDAKARAEAALAEAGLSGVQVIVRGDKASLTGSVPHHAARKQAADVILGLGGISEVNTDSLVNLAARDGTTYTVVGGDTLSRIAQRMYGDATRAQLLLNANPELGGKASALRIGQVLRVPPLPE